MRRTNQTPRAAFGTVYVSNDHGSVITVVQDIARQTIEVWQLNVTTNEVTMAREWNYNSDTGEEQSRINAFRLARTIAKLPTAA